MRVGGVEAKRGGLSEPMIFSRKDGDIVFIAQPVHDLKEFEALCPLPDVKQWGSMTNDGWVPDPNHPAYRDQIKLYKEKRWAYLVIKTLEPSNIEWSKVDINKPQTWVHYKEELEAVLSYTEVGHLVTLIEDTNTLTTAKLEENRESFLRKQEALRQQGAQQQEHSQTTEAENSSSGELASVQG